MSRPVYPLQELVMGLDGAIWGMPGTRIPDDQKQPYVEKAHELLCRITEQDFGYDKKAWSMWLKNNFSLKKIK